MDNLTTPLGRLRWAGILEGASFIILLFLAMPLKYMAGKPGMVQVTGMAHGILFILYILLSVQSKWFYRWPLRRLLLLWLASILPFGTLVADYKILRHQQGSVIP